MEKSSKNAPLSNPEAPAKPKEFTELTELLRVLSEGKPFGYDPATDFLHADDGGAPESCVFYVPKSEAPAAAVGVKELIERLLDMRDTVMRGARCVSVDGPAVKPVINTSAIRIFDDVAEALAALVATPPASTSAVDGGIANLLTNCAQILDVVKGEWSKDGSWTSWDQSVRDGITASLSAQAVPAAMGGARVEGVDIPRLPVGTQVIKAAGYPYPGEVRAAFTTIEGKERFVVEATGTDYQGMLHIFNGDQLSEALAVHPSRTAGGEEKL